MRRKKPEVTQKKIILTENEFDTNGNVLAVPEERDTRTFDEYDNDQKHVEQKDKIFYNDFNVGNIDSHSLPNLKVETNYAGSYLGDSYDAEEYEERKRLFEMVYDAFKSSQWGNMDIKSTKKINKDLIPFIFNDIYKRVEGKGYTTSDLFICIAEFLDVSYEKLYDSIGIKIKEELLKEMDAKYKVLSRRNIKRLF